MPLEGKHGLRQLKKEENVPYKKKEDCGKCFKGHCPLFTLLFIERSNLVPDKFPKIDTGYELTNDGISTCTIVHIYGVVY
jgi:hypothetical protein